MSPSWAGWSVIAIAALPGGQSLQKGLLRVWGTLLACFVGIVIISLGAQERWLFMILTASWVSFCAYKMLSDKKLSYFWFVAGYVTLVISAAGPSSTGGFYIAVFRTIETILGIVVYTLVAVFIWPLSNLGSIKRTLNALVATQTVLIQQVGNILFGNENKKTVQDLRKTQVKQMGAFSKSLIDEGVENYRVQELKPLWNQFEDLNKNLLKSFDRLFGGIEDASKIDISENNTDLADYFEELNLRFLEISNLLSGKAPSTTVRVVDLNLGSFDRSHMSHFDNAALTIIIRELNKMEVISRSMVDVAYEITGYKSTEQRPENRNIRPKNKFGYMGFVLDIEYLKGSLFVASAIISGFIIWFYINPPGHASWYIMGGVFALIFSGTPQLKTVKLIVPFLFVMFATSLLYMFVIPKLSSFNELGLLLFTCMFIIQYFMPGPVSLLFTIAILQLMVINNPQTFDPSALVNSFVFIPMFFTFLYGLSYITNAPRPEKALLMLVSRFFTSAQHLIQLQPGDHEASSSYAQKYRTAFHLYELQTLPAKIRAWGKAIDKELFPNTDFDQIDELCNSLEIFIVRMEILMEAKTNTTDKEINMFNEVLMEWKNRLIETFDCWDNIPEEKIKTDSGELVHSSLSLLEEKLQALLIKNEKTTNKDEAIEFYYLLGGYRGITEATLSFAQVADKLNWKQWKGEKFQ